MNHTVPPALAHGNVRPGPLLFLFLLIYASTLVAASYWFRGIDSVVRSNIQAFAAIATIGVATVLVAVLVPELRRSFPLLFGRGHRRLEILDAALVLGIMLTWGMGMSRLIFTLPLTAFFPPGFGWAALLERAPDYSRLSLFVHLAASGLLAPLAEEFFFRGLLMNLWIARRGVAGGVVLSSLAFGLVHGHFLVFATGGGVVLALCYLRFGSLWPGIVLHGLYNMVIGLPAVNLVVRVKTRADILDPSQWIVEGFLAILFVPIAVLFWRRFRPNS